MAGKIFFGKQKLCYTDVSDFTDFQGVGHDPLYKRYENVMSVVRKSVPESMQHFLAAPDYLGDEDQICWYVDKWNEHPEKLGGLTGLERDKYEAVYADTLNAYRQSVNSLDGEDLRIMAGVIKYVDKDRVYCCDGKVYLVAWGMTPDENQHKVIGSVIHEIAYQKKFKVTFDAGDHGAIPITDKSINKAEGSALSSSDFPQVDVSEGWNFVGWQPSPDGVVVSSDLHFTAQYAEIPPVVPPEIPPEEPQDVFYSCRFDSGDKGTVNGNSVVRMPAGAVLANADIPAVTPRKGFKFTGWDISPYNCLVDGDKVFTAQYEEVLPWYKRFWRWLVALFTGNGCLKKLLWLLLALLLFLLLSWLLRGCLGCSGHAPVNGVAPLDSVARGDGRMADDNGRARSLTGDDGSLPADGSIVAPITDGDGSEAPIVEHPGAPSTIANRLFLFMENENDNVEALAQDFKKAYPDDKYSIIGYDKEVKLLVIQIPENERDRIRQTINSRIPNHKFIVFDEEIYELNGQENASPQNPGWHIKATHMPEGWKITKGSPNVKIAVVDDGIDAAHPMFKGRIVDAYNVFTQNNRLSTGAGHGTHTAGLAAGGTSYLSRGAAGVAPGCKLMPIQVFDNGKCPLSALVAGVMYAIHHGADVVNLSVGPSFKGLDQLSPEEQERIANSQFKNVEMLWRRVCGLAARKRCILVFSSGNDNILSSIPPENRNESAIVVTAVDKNLYPTDFTNYGPGSDISAPGKDIMSAFPHGKLKSFDGTSMAAPIVSGTVALMKSLKKDITVEQVRNVLYKTGGDVYGNIPPMVLVDKALTGVKKGDFSRPAERQMKPVPGAEDEVAAPVSEAPVAQAPPQDNGGVDYSAIRRKIAEYKKKISELEKLLPNKH